MSHAHHHGPPTSVGTKLLASAVATILLVGLEIGFGLWSGSLALIGDAFHNFTDALALLLALFAIRLERRPATSDLSYGYQRAGILAAFINSGTLIALTLLLVVEAVSRIRRPEPVDSFWMLVVAAAALVLNAVITIALRREGHDDVNVRSAVIHMLGDAISSAGIIVAALLIRFTGALWWDPAVSLAIAALIVWSSWGILRETVNLLLEGTPSGIDPEAVTRALSSIDGVYGVHHLHIWALASSRPALSCHLMVGDVPVRSTGRLLDEITGLLERDYRIEHATIQFEFADCGDDPYCIPYEVAHTDGAELPHDHS